MIRVPNELRDACVGSTVNLFVSVGTTSRRLKGEVYETRDRGENGDVLEVRISEDVPGESDIRFWLGVADESTYLLPLDAYDDRLVYVEYRHNGARIGLNVRDVREVGLR
ncbi:MAG: hypothetical protein RI560_08305 [Natronomonas sp.]|jgi:hypothetical protein|uniref:Uncharacterized protein n=1 Tax=Natronomonas salsuginis TaxID=2217661 RepID=A0A4U5JHQ9_9EURY|nr:MULTISPECIES: hypothetical protein [Natronomonas]MDR9381655.1 hypothetical protein [Natronomonas sp.]MDR9429681.1 hypothetical protein [Natronomonas sp.]TKR27538.1 hypothetical protein DM868_00110 [Natronomonas salsuginis]